MVGWLSKVGNILTGGLITDTGEAIDRNVTSDEERAKLKNEFQQIAQQYSGLIQEQVSQRHQADMTSDSWLSKNIRPLSLIFLLGAVTFFAFGDGIAWFNIPESYITLFERLLILAFGFYFGGRTMEKFIAIKKNNE